MRGALGCIALVALTAGAEGAQRGLARVRTAQLPPGAKARSALLLDRDGDGGADLVVSADLRRGRASRALSIYRAGDGDALSPGEVLELTPDVVAYAVGDVHADPGEEIVLFNAGGAFVWRPGKPAAERFARLVEAAFLWQLADPDEVFPWSAGVRDLDGDGRVDLLLPEPGGYRVALQRRGDEGARFEVAGELRVPVERAVPDGSYLAASPDGSVWRGRRSEAELRLSLSVGSGVDDDYGLPTTLLSVVESAPAPQVVDWDGDGDLDLLGQTRTLLHVWPQSGGRFADGARRSFPLPVAADRDRRLDASYSSHALDLDGDRRADCVIFAGDRRSDDVRTQSLVFVQGAGRGEAAQTPDAPLFGPRGLPQDLLVFAGFVATVRFPRLDADALPDLVVTAVRPDLIDQLRAVSSESIDTELFAYLNRAGRFPRRPDLAWRISLPLERFDATVRFVGDVTRDGTSELVVRDTPERLRLLMVRAARGREGLEVVERPLWQLAVGKDAEVDVMDVPGRDVADLLVNEGGQVLHVRFP